MFYFVLFDVVEFEVFGIDIFDDGYYVLVLVEELIYYDRYYYLKFDQVIKEIISYLCK